MCCCYVVNVRVRVGGIPAPQHTNEIKCDPPTRRSNPPKHAPPPQKTKPGAGECAEQPQAVGAGQGLRPPLQPVRAVCVSCMCLFVYGVGPVVRRCVVVDVNNNNSISSTPQPCVHYTVSSQTHDRLLENVKEMWTEVPKSGKGKKAKPVRAGDGSALRVFWEGWDSADVYHDVSICPRLTFHTPPKPKSHSKTRSATSPSSSCGATRSSSCCGTPTNDRRQDPRSTRKQSNVS